MQLCDEALVWLEASGMALKTNDVYIPIEDSTALEAIVEGEKESHSPSPQNDERNRDYLIRRAALSDNPSPEEMDAVVA